MVLALHGPPLRLRWEEAGSYVVVKKVPLRVTIIHLLQVA
jgi:hypothetical protein